MATVKDHYDSHLAPLYTWISGGADTPRARFTAFLDAHQLRPSAPGATALDLGAGSGFQALPLAAAGYAVTAVDVSEVLLAELAREAATAGLPIRAVLGDMTDLARHCPSPAPALIVCMGDTLTHLGSLDAVARLLRDAAQVLAPGGHLVLTFRNYTVARTGADRFIPVRSDVNRIFTCFLDFGTMHVTVHDIVHSREAAGWRMAVSTYEKIRVAPAWVRAQLLAAGLQLIRDDLAAGLATFIARRPLVT